MTNQSTIDKLIEMRLTAMADAFRIQMDDPAMKEVPFEDRFGMLVDVEYSNRKNNRLKRLIRQAELEQPDASIAAIDYHLNNPVPVSLLSGDRKPQIRFLGNHHSGSGNLYHKSFRM